MREPSIHLLRRSFLKGLGLAASGFALGAFATDAHADDSKIPKADIKPSDPATAAKTAAKGAGLKPNVFVHVGADDVVTIVCARSEMGQGVRSSLPVLVADEMGADMARVKIVQGDGDQAYGDQNTDGSHSVRGMFEDLRRVGATARMMLVATAAKRWQVPAASCTAHDNAVFHPPTQRSLRFGELADEAGAQPTPKKNAIKLRPLSELSHLGKELPLLDGPDIVTGRAVFGADVIIPGMLTAVVARPPVLGGKVLRFDAANALAVKGVRRVVLLPEAKRPFGFQPLGGIAVVADHTWAALRGRAALEISWDHGTNEKYDSHTYRAQLMKALESPGKSARNVGDADAALASAEKRVEALYYVPHLAHATMEPPVAVAKVDKNGCEVWTCTQNPQAAQIEVAKALGIDPQKVTIHVTLLGGGFGRKSKPDYVVEAALVSKEMGAPVRLQWTREDDVQHDYYHSVSAQRLSAGLDQAGKVVAWRHRSAFPTIGSTFTGAQEPSEGELQQGVLDTPLALPNVRAEGCEAIAHTRTSNLDAVRTLLRAQRAARVEAVTTSSQAESLAAGLCVLDRSGSTPHDVIIVTPVDMLPAQARTHHVLLARLDETLLAVTPTHAGRGGHPVIARRALFGAHQANGVGAQPLLPSLREVLAGALATRLRVEVDDPRVLGDLDTPADVRALGSSQ